MSQVSIEPKPKWKLWAFFLIVLSFSAALSVTMRVFSFYTLLHWQKVLILGSLMITFGLFSLRYLLPGFIYIKLSKQRLVTTLGFALGLTMIFMALNYHMAPIRTLHTLELANISDHVDITLDHIKYSDGKQIDLISQFPGYAYQGEKLILKPGQSLEFSREMVGGLDISAHALLDVGEMSVVWDKEEQIVEIVDYKNISLPGWSWGEPILLYKITGLASIITDVVTIMGSLFCLSWFACLLKNKFPKEVTTPISGILKPYTTPILISFGFTILAVIIRLWITDRTGYSLALMVLGFLPFIPYFFEQHRKWALQMALPLIILGILFNIYIFISPINELHITPEILMNDSFVKLAQKAGDSTYLSMGYYPYFKNTILHIPADLMKKLNLYTNRLEQMNTGLQVVDGPYDYQLVTEVADQWIEDYDWQTWPREVEGTFYLNLDNTHPGDELYFFQSGDRYFLVSIDFLSTTGIMDVSILY